MTPVDIHVMESGVSGAQPTGAVERARLSKAWDQTFAATRVVTQRSGSAELLQQNTARPAHSQLAAPAAEVRETLRGGDEVAGRGAASEVAGQGHVNSDTALAHTPEAPAGVAGTTIVTREAELEREVTTRVRGNAIRNADDASALRNSDPVVRVFRHEDGLVVTVVHPALTTPADILRVIAEVRKSAQSLGTSIRSIRINGNPVAGAEQGLKVDPAPGSEAVSHEVDFRT